MAQVSGFSTRPIEEDYEIRWDKKLGAGVNGEVVLCISKKTGEKYALKCLRAKDRAKREIQLQKQCSEHPNVVKVQDIFDNTFKRPTDAKESRYFLVVLEFMSGGELFTRIKAKKFFNEKEAAGIIRMAAGAVGHLHKFDIAHRDLKPENLLYSSTAEDAPLKLADFGFAKLDRGDLVTPVYTPYYVPQEILAAQRVQQDKKAGLLPKSAVFAYDKSCDMWSLGVILYIMLCGYPPFASEVRETNLSDRMKKKIAKGEFTFHEKYWAKVSDQAKEVVQALLNANPSQRITAAQLLLHPWVLHGEGASEESLESIQNMQPDQQSAESTAAMAHYKDQMMKMRRPDKPIGRVNASAGREELMRRRKEKLAAKAQGEGAPTSRFANKVRSKRASLSNVVVPDAPQARGVTRGTQALEKLLAMCASGSVGAGDIATQANSTLSQMNADLKYVQKAIQTSVGRADGAINAAALHQMLSRLVIPTEAADGAPRAAPSQGAPSAPVPVIKVQETSKTSQIL